MEYLATGLVLLVAIEHVYILVLEMFLWTTPKARKAFGMSKEEAQSTTVLAANQGLYNGFLAAGLFWGLIHSNAEFAFQIQVFFLACIMVAAVYGAATAKKSIIIVQGLPATLAMIAVLVSAV
jgi:putative membrane protein